MKNFVLLLSIGLLYCSIIPAQTINIDYNNPLWSFDYMREAWKNNVDFLETEYRMQTDSIHAKQEFRDYYGQALMTVQTFNGRILEKDRTNLFFRNPIRKLKQSENLSETIHPANAKDFILKNFLDEKVIMFNEAHLYPQHRAFINSLLKDLYDHGYRHLFMEALSAEYEGVACPEREMGVYTNEPCMANLVRNAIQTGFRLHAYDGYAYKNRDSVSAENINKVIQNNSRDKFIILCGFDHNNEKRFRSLASYLNKIAQINPLTIDLTIYSEPESSNFYNELLEYYHIETPSILTDTNNKQVAMKNSSGRDLYVVFPHTKYVHDYPQWIINQRENKFDSLKFSDYDVAKVYIKEELTYVKSPIPYSFKYKNNDNTILVPLKDYIIRFYKLKEGKLIPTKSSEPNDSISRSIQLDEVTIVASNVSRVDNHLVIYPNTQQKKSSNSGYTVLKRLMIPGFIIDSQSNTTEAMGMPVSFYINGQQADSKDIQMIRPKDIEKIEYHDNPSGKYAKDKIAVNFILKQYKTGGYFQVDGLQTIGYTHGDYNIATSVNHNNTTYSLFAGSDYYNVSDNMSNISENCILSNQSIDRLSNSVEDYSRHSEYLQFRFQHQKAGRYIVGKLSLINKNTPRNKVDGAVQTVNNSSDFTMSTDQKSLSPKLDLTGTIPISKTQNFTFGLHGTYSRNLYNRTYLEQKFETDSYESENAGSFQLSAIYNLFKGKHSFSAELFDYHNMWDAQYEGSHPLKQSLWKNESLAFLSYNYAFTPKFSLRTRVGMDWLQYRLQNCENYSKLHPRLSINLQYRLKAGMLLWSSSYNNSNYGMDIINQARIGINPYLIQTGNPDLKSGRTLNSYLYYSGQIKKLGLSAIVQYKLEQDPVVHNYYAQDDYIVKSFINSGNIHYYSAILAASYKFNKIFSLSGDMRYNYTSVNSVNVFGSHNLTGNLNANIYLGDFSISPFVNFRNKVVNTTSLDIVETPINYGLECTFSKGNFFAELNVLSPFTNRIFRKTYLNELYRYYSEEDLRTSSQFCNIKLAYTFDFGYKTKKVKQEVDKTINSSLLRSF